MYAVLKLTSNPSVNAQSEIIKIFILLNPEVIVLGLIRFSICLPRNKLIIHLELDLGKGIEDLVEAFAFGLSEDCSYGCCFSSSTYYD